MSVNTATVPTTEIPDPPIAKFIFSDGRMAPVWLAIRLYVGYQWLSAGWGKLTESGWVGDQAGKSMSGFVAGALNNATAAHPTVQPYYAWFLQNLVQPNVVLWSYLITFGEILVGLGLILGLFTGFAAFFGGLMNANYLLAGTLSVNPLLFILATWLVLAWKVAGLWGLDYFVLPRIGVPGAGGTFFQRWAPARVANSAPAVR
jgi:thiosulfate dehydrogenase [quinone] large subunit